MSISKSIKIISTLALSAVVLSACGKDDDSATGGDPVDMSSVAILEYIPADSPYVFTSLAPLPDDVMDTLEPKLDRVLASYRTILSQLVGEVRDDASEAEARRVGAFVNALSKLFSVEGMRSAGITRDSLGAFYGNGLLPVARIQLSDGALFEDMLADIEAEAGGDLLSGVVDGQPYRYFDADKLRVVIAVIDDQAVISFLPSFFEDAQISRALGLTKPARNITETGILEALIEDYDYTNHMVGFIDIPAIVERFVGEPTGLDADLLAFMEGDKPALSDVCKAEIRDVANIAPRIAMGYTGVSSKQFDANIVVEVRDDIAKELQALPTAVPGLGGDAGGLMSFGMSLDVQAARSFIESRVEALENDPYECVHLADLQSTAADMRASLNQPVPPMIYDFKGFLAVIDDIEGLDVATQTPPTSFDGSFLLAMDNARALVAMGAMFSPELAALGLEPGGDPVPLDLPQLQAMGISAFAALTDNALAVSVGDNAEAEVQAVLEGEASNPAPFMSFSVDAGRYYAFLGDAMAIAEPDGSDGGSPEMAAATGEMMSALADLYDRMTVDVYFTANGIEMLATETFKD